MNTNRIPAPCRATIPTAFAFCAGLAVAAFFSPASQMIAADATAAATGNLVVNGDFETGQEGASMPDHWAAPDAGRVSWETHENATDGNGRFLRIASTEPGSMVLVYRAVPLPPGTKAIEISIRGRITGLQRGAEIWHDARVMLDFKNAAQKKLKPGPRPIFFIQDTTGWSLRKTRALVPEGATMLEFMPCLFNVKSGTFDLDDVVVRAIDPAELQSGAK